MIGKTAGNLRGEILLLRADASVAIGTGHVMRCLALAQAWQDAGGKVTFAMAQSTLPIKERVLKEKFTFVPIAAAPGSADDGNQLLTLARAQRPRWIVIDGYQFGEGYQRALKNEGFDVLLIDDNGREGIFAADLVLNQNMHANQGPALYRNQSRETYTTLLLGTKYALLRREFLVAGESRQIAPVGRKILVSMGGSDPDNATCRVMEAIERFEAERLEVTLVVGGSNPHLAAVTDAASKSRHSCRVLSDVKNMREIIAWADFAVSAAGSACWEYCALALPAILIAVAENQRANSEALHAAGAARLVAGGSGFPISEMTELISRLVKSPSERESLSRTAGSLVDGKGASRVLGIMLGKKHVAGASGMSATATLRDAAPGDRDRILAWRNLPRVADYMFTDHVISAQEHAAWFARILQDPTYKYWIIVCDGEDVGVANLYGIDVLNRHCYWGFYVGEPKVNMRNGSVGTRVEFAVLNHVFEDMKFEKLSCESLALNRGVIAMHRRFGFAQEGFFRRQVWKQGRFHDVVRMAILREEWQALRPRFQRMLTEAADQLQQTE